MVTLFTGLFGVLTLDAFAQSREPNNGSRNVIRFIPVAEQIPSLTPKAISNIPKLPALDTPELVPLKQEELDKVISEAKPLETQARWADVMLHYETAMRTHRFDPSLMERYRVARFHYDVGRRFHDASYINLMNHSGVADTIRFFDEVTGQIANNYADTPNWDKLFRLGLLDLSIALQDSGFCSHSGIVASQTQVQSCWQEIQKMANGWEIRHCEDLKNGILHIAEMLQKQLSVRPSASVMELTCGMINSLDVYSTYLTPRQLQEQHSMCSGNLVGLGVELRSDADSLIILRVISGSPAQEAGLLNGDRILAVDGVTTKGRDTDSAADMLQGAEGTAVRLNILSRGFGERARDVTVVRREIDVPSVENTTMITDKLGYARLTSFQWKTPAELSGALNELQQRGMQCLVLDMRGNPGGLFSVGTEIANMFIESGAIVRTQGRDHSLDSPEMAKPGKAWKMPLIVLIDEESASAAEIVAGALRDHNRAVLIGKRTYGKGTVQQIIPLRNSAVNGKQSGIKLTVERFYSPKGWGYSGVGVSPNIVVQENPNRVLLAKPVNGHIVDNGSRRLEDDPFIRQAIKTAQTLLY